MASSSISTPVVDNEVSLFWDLNKCPMTNVSNLNRIVEIIEHSLADLNRAYPNYHPKYRLSNTKIVCGELEKLGEDGIEVLQNQGFTVLHAAEREPFCDKHYKRKSSPAPDFLLESYLLKYIDHRPGNILIISGDYKFMSSMRNFQSGGYTIFLAKRRDSNLNIGTYASYGWDWEDMERGQNGLKIDRTPPRT